MKKSPVETILGLAVLVFTGLFLFFAASRVNIKSVEGYPILTSFSKVGGLEEGADVRIGGVKVGSVLKMSLEPETYQVKTILSIQKDVKIPEDSSAAIVDSGLMGDKYVKIDPGLSRVMLKPDEAIKKCQDYRSLEDTIGRLIYSVTQ